MAESRNPTAARELTPFVEMALGALEREFPFHSTLMLSGDTDFLPPREATPAFCTCFDWHSSVHSHWALVRALRVAPDAPWAGAARTRLGRSLTPSKLAVETAFMSSPGREGFERPYGLAWVLQLAAELRLAPEPESAGWSSALEPLERLAAARLHDWLAMLPWPVRAGEHSQSAFAMGLCFDWARAGGDAAEADHVAFHARRLYAADRAAPAAWEPSAQDFLSPLLAEADLLRRAMPAGEFRAWLAEFLPAPDAPILERWLTPVESPDPADGKFAHLNGLNLSRAWMLEGVVETLEDSHEHRAGLARAAARHREAGLAGAVTTHYAGWHWLGSFAIYLLTRRGLT